MIQHTTPCKECPFRRVGLPGWLGGSSAETFIGQAHGEFWLPCHLHSDYSNPNWGQDTSKPQCAGAAIYRANVFKQTRGRLLTLPADRDLVFAHAAEFLAYHKGIPLKKAAQQLKAQSVTHLLIQEIGKALDSDGPGFIQENRQ